jgi:uncharacterized protein YndB with AHSA1/START domain
MPETMTALTNPTTLTVTRPGDREIVLSRAFDAPRERVFAALTTPAAVRQWLAPCDFTLAECEMDLRVGGAWRLLMRRPDGEEFAMRGVYREVSAPKRYVHTESYDGHDGWGELFITTELAESGGRTTVTLTLLHPSRECRDANAHVEQGVAQAYDKLGAYLACAA